MIALAAAPYWSNMHGSLYNADCLEFLRSLPDGLAHCCVTSPPYYGLRDYGHDGQIGLEPTPDEYVAKLVAVFREVRRVLRDDGTLWLNIGDSYAANRTYQVNSTKGGPKHGVGQSAGGKGSTVPVGLKPKDLIGIPWLLAFALRADGWYLRQDIIWHKPNPMPESVTDRCTKAHEYIFLLSKSQRYYYDHEAIREPVQSTKGNAKSFRGGGSYTGGNSFNNHAEKERETRGNEPNEDGKRNKRSVWTVTPKPFKGAHFATFPPDLIEPCILAGAPEYGIVIEPFNGAGTTPLVAQRNNRLWLSSDISTDYCDLTVARLETP